MISKLGDGLNIMAKITGKKWSLINRIICDSKYPSRYQVRKVTHKRCIEWISKFLDSWITSISGYKIDEMLPMSISLVYYLADQDRQSQIIGRKISSNELLLTGSNSAHGQYHVNFYSDATSHLVGLEASPERAWDAVELLKPYLPREHQMTDFVAKRQNFVAAKYCLTDQFSIQTSFGKSHQFSVDLKKESKAFHRQFTKTFPQLVRTNMYSVCKFALSNLLGSISYNPPSSASSSYWFK